MSADQNDKTKPTFTKPIFRNVHLSSNIFEANLKRHFFEWNSSAGLQLRRDVPFISAEHILTRHLAQTDLHNLTHTVLAQHSSHIISKEHTVEAVLSKAEVALSGVALTEAIIAEATLEETALAEGVASSDPPKIAELLLAFLLGGAKGEAAIGDLSERFERDREKYGAARARRIYWSRALRSLWPLLRRAAGRALKWGVIFESVRRFFSG